MAIHLEEYQDLLDDLPSKSQEVLEASWHEAGRMFSSRGLDNYIKGANALHNLGRGEDLVVTYIQEMPEVARAIGEDVLPDVVNFLLGMASKTSGQVLTLIVGTAPLAAERLGDEDLFRKYLNVLSIMLAQAPRGLRPMLENLDRLLTQLTLGGLRRWVMWGAQAYKADFDGQVNYFSLQSADAMSVLQQERKGTLFVDVQRRLNIYLRAMWGRDFFLRPTAGDYEVREGLKPYIGMTANAILLHADQSVIELELDAQLAWLDETLAEIFTEGSRYTRPKDLSPFPILGMPGWMAENACEAFYDNPQYFRPGRGGHMKTGTDPD